MSPAEGGLEVIESNLIGDVGNRETKRHMRVVALIEQIVRAEADIEDVTRRDTRRVLIVIGCAFGRYF